jgi:hypothetical protein
VNGLEADLHEFGFTDTGTALITVYDIQHVDLTPLGGTQMVTFGTVSSRRLRLIPEHWYSNGTHQTTSMSPNLITKEGTKAEAEVLLGTASTSIASKKMLLVTV